MDPSTTLFTFMLQTDPSVQFVHLVGSWDNFSTYYRMERDSRRGFGQWRGCYSFRDTICTDENGRGLSKKNGGLRMGSTYYYYYELDGSQEIHDPNMPSTTACPSLPGQQLNTLTIPVEHTLRHRSASLSSMRAFDYKTMNPKDRFTTPRPPPSVPESLQRPPSRVGSSPAPSSFPKMIARSVSPAPSWKRFLSFRMNRGDSDRGRSMSERPVTPASSIMSMMDDTQSITSEGSRTRDISPESLRRFLSDDAPATPAPEDRPTLIIPEDIAEENEDDDNFATSAVSEFNFFATSLSPPPTSKSHSRSASAATIDFGLRPPPMRKAKADPIPEPEPLIPYNTSFTLPTISTPGPRSYFSPASSIASPMSPRSPDDSIRTYYESADRDVASPSASSGDEEEVFIKYQRLSLTSKRSSGQHSPLFPSYRLPEDNTQKRQGSECEPQVAIDSPSLLESWMADVIHAKRN